MNRTLDLNCDMGEGFGAWHMGDDEALMPLVTSANIACGGHAGDPGTMRRTVAEALRHGSTGATAMRNSMVRPMGLVMRSISFQ